MLKNGCFSVNLSRLARVNWLNAVVLPYYTSGSRIYEDCVRFVFGRNRVEVLSDVRRLFDSEFASSGVVCVGWAFAERKC